MRVISLWQPWASLWMAPDLKMHETRHWDTRYRGPLAVHAALRQPSKLELDPDFAAQVRGDLAIHSLDQLPRGCVIGVLDLEATIETDGPFTPGRKDEMYGDWSPGRFAWLGVNRRPLREPLPMRGRQGLWTPTPEERAEIEARMMVVDHV